MKKLKEHEAASLFPMMSGDRLAELSESIKNEGLIHPIVLCDGKILDGRNRYKACLETGVKPRFEKFSGDPFSYVWSTNGQRRDLSQPQRYAIWLIANEHSEEWRAAEKRRQAEANRKRSESQKGVPKRDKERNPTTSGATSHSKAGAIAKAAASHTDRGTVEKVDAVRRKNPELFEEIISGTKTLTAAQREVKKSEVEQKIAALPKGTYRVIYADPPWKYGDEREGLGAADGAKVDRASTAARDHYPTMEKSKLAALDIKKLAHEDAVLFCWATFPLLVDALDIVKAWGFKYKTAFVWDKQKGTFGHYHKAESELLLVCTRGSCTPDADRRENQVNRWPRAEHSRKPEQARAMIDRLYKFGDRIELFARGDMPDGWVGWGAELNRRSSL